MSTNACTSVNGTLGTKTGAQCLEAVTVLYILAKEDQAFEDIELFASQAAWDAAVEAGDVVPLWELYDFANANTEAAYYENRNFKKRTVKATKIYDAEVYLSLCEQKLLKSYQDSDYTKLYEVTEDGYIIGVLSPKDGKVRGQTISNFDVGIRNNATTDKVPNTKISITFKDYEELEDNPAMVNPDFNPVIDLEGIQEVHIGIQSASATGAELRIYTYCGNEHMEGVTADMLTVINGDGTVVDTSAATLVDNGTLKLGYTLSGLTGLSGEIKIGIDGTQTDANGDLFKSGLDTHTVV